MKGTKRTKRTKEEINIGAINFPRCDVGEIIEMLIIHLHN